MKNRNDIDRIVHFAKHEDVGKATQQGPACVSEGWRKLLWILRNPGHRRAQGITKLRPNMRGVGVVPADRIGKIRPSRLRKKNPGHLSWPTIQLRVDILPGDCIAAVRVKARKPAVELGLVRGG